MTKTKTLIRESGTMTTQSEVDFVRECHNYMCAHPSRIPFDRTTGNLVMNWMLERAEAKQRAAKAEAL